MTSYGVGVLRKRPIRPAFLEFHINLINNFAVCVDTCHNRNRDLTQAPHLMDFFRGLVFATMSDANGLVSCLQTIDENNCKSVNLAAS